MTFWFGIAECGGLEFGKVLQSSFSTAECVDLQSGEVMKTSSRDVKCGGLESGAKLWWPFDSNVQAGTNN